MFQRFSLALVNPAFRRYLLCSGSSTLASWLQRFLLGWHAWELTQSAFWVGICSVLMLLPALFLAPVFGVLADRLNPQRGMLATIGLQGLVAAAAALADAHTGLNLAWLLSVALSVGVITAAHHPLRLALIPKLVGREAMASAVGISAMVFNASRIIGPALGGWLLVQGGAASGFAVAAALFALGVMALVGVPTAAASHSATVRRSLVAQLRAGFVYAAQTPLIRLVFMYTCINGLLGRSIVELLPALAGKLLAGDPHTLAVLAAAAGAGSIAGGLFIARQASDTTQLTQLVRRCLLGCALVTLPIYFVESLLGLALLVALVSLATTMVGTACQTITQLDVCDQLRGRVMSLWVVLTMASPAIGAFVMGACADLLGFVPTLLGFALVVAGLVGIGRQRVCQKSPGTKRRSDA